MLISKISGSSGKDSVLGEINPQQGTLCGSLIDNYCLRISEVRMKEEKELRELMVRYLDTLLLKQHILIRSTLDQYKFRLELGENLTPKEFTTILKFLDRDSRMTRKELRGYFDKIIDKGTNKSINKVTNRSSLEDHFCNEEEPILEVKTL